MKAKRLHSQALHLRQRFNGRLFFVVFIVMMIATVITVSRQTRMYEASGTLKVSPIQVQTVRDVMDTHISCGLDLNTVRAIVASNSFLQRVVDRLTPEERKLFLSPYGHLDHSDEVIERLILSCRTIVMDSTVLTVEVRYRHPDGHMAARIVSLFLEESVVYDERVRKDDIIAGLETLKQRAAQASQEAEVCEQAVVAYRKSHPNLKVEEMEQDLKYQALVEKAAIWVDLHLKISARISEVSSLDGFESAAYRISQPPVTPDEDDYLVAPLAVTFGWGTLIATVTAGLAGVLFKRRPISAKQSEVL